MDNYLKNEEYVTQMGKYNAWHLRRRLVNGVHLERSGLLLDLGAARIEAHGIWIEIETV